MIYYIITLCILLINIIINNSINRRILYPPTLFSIIWFVVLLLHMLAAATNYLGIQYVSIYSLIIFTIGPCVFTIGGYIGYLSSIKKKSYSRDELYINKKFLNTLMLLSTILLPLYAYESYQIVMANSITGDFMRDLRLNLNSGEATRKYVHGIIFSFFYMFICLYGLLLNKISKSRFLFSLILIIIYCLLSTGRVAFLQLFIIILGTISVVKKLKLKYLLIALSTFLVIFFIYGFIFKKGTSENATFNENIESMIDNTSIYFLGGTSAFDYKMLNGFNDFNGERTFRLPIAILNKLGLIDAKPQELIEEIVYVPFATNVFTSYQVYVEDFGIYYIIIVLFIQSLLHSKLFYNSINFTKYRVQNTYMYSYLLYPLLMTFFQDQFINLIPTWIYAFILVIVSKKFIYYKKI